MGHNQKTLVLNIIFSDGTMPYFILRDQEVGSDSDEEKENIVPPANIRTLNNAVGCSLVTLTGICCNR